MRTKTPLPIVPVMLPCGVVRTLRAVPVGSLTMQRPVRCVTVDGWSVLPTHPAISGTMNFAETQPPIWPYLTCFQPPTPSPKIVTSRLSGGIIPMMLNSAVGCSRICRTSLGAMLTTLAWTLPSPVSDAKALSELELASTARARKGIYVNDLIEHRTKRLAFCELRETGGVDWSEVETSRQFRQMGVLDGPLALRKFTLRAWIVRD